MVATVYRFADRSAAGKSLAKTLSLYSGRIDTIVLALPRGGVPVAHEIAKALRTPMDLWIVRKLGVPGDEELAMGTLAGKDLYILNEDIISQMKIKKEDIDRIIAREKEELERRNRIYRQGRPAPDVAGKTVIVVDDGLATGSTMRAAVTSLRLAGAAWIVAAIPVCSIEAKTALANEADEVICTIMPEPFFGVGLWYEDFTQTTDKEVQYLLSA